MSSRAVYFITLALICCLLRLSSQFVEGHARWTYPSPRTSDAGLKTYPCGGIQFHGQGQPVTTLSPGKQILKFEETISHRGAPFRIALSINDDSSYDKYILIDHIPHNDATESNPVKVYQYEVIIPDINCPKCSLALTNPMTDKITSGTCCSYPTASGSSPQCFSVYHSCANIVITGTKSVQQFMSSGYNYTGPCGDYTQEAATWTRQSDESWKLTQTFTNFYIPPTNQRCSNFASQCKNGTFPIVNPSTSGKRNNGSSVRTSPLALVWTMVFGVVQILSALTFWNY
ncbi:hypothetical protein C9374_010506 [Naegleria lovaniensis]|uniref:Chitin-binding type-4 domain-containing protein n=1 Tax=Naegleria lovaniensis TaxID=51637 RepID=A0AA88GBU8_NAELO|nr:uncharacterized protein C9374_010506 [Naegleria lovaniensis]KAG2374762.1 hypothetical protein C9374_010506 [Naegleria lovaniensis]